MEYIRAFFSNYMLICGIVAWFAAQILKIPGELYRHRGLSFRRILFGNGGMPSSHSATVCAVSCAAAIKFGLDSSAFAICCVLAMIVMNDAMGVRRETGDQARVLNKIVADLPEEKADDIMPRALKEMVGHTPLQVVIGGLVGLVIPFLMQYIPAFGLH